MKLAAALYLSNQATIGYPVGYVLETLGFADEIFLLGGDDDSFHSLAVLSAQRPLGEVDGVELIDIVVKTPGDIPRMMMASVDYVRAHSDADFILLVQADTCATDDSAQLVREAMTEANLAKAYHTYCRIGFLYQDSATGWGHSLVGRNFRGRFDGDGDGYDEGGHKIGFLGGWRDGGLSPDEQLERGHLLGCLEIGSLSPDLYFRHQSQHVQTWNETWLMGERLAAMRRGDREEFIKLSLTDARDRIVRRPLRPIEGRDPRFTKVIDDLGLRQDCEDVCRLVQKFGFDQ